MSVVAVLDSDMSVNIIGGTLVVVGLVLLVVTLGFWRSALEDPEVLAPLEVMADRRFGRANEERRSTLLNRVRGEGAAPIEFIEPVHALVREPLVEPVRAFKDPFPHDDDAVDVVTRHIDPLLKQQFKNE